MIFNFIFNLFLEKSDNPIIFNENKINEKNESKNQNVQVCDSENEKDNKIILESEKNGSMVINENQIQNKNVEYKIVVMQKSNEESIKNNYRDNNGTNDVTNKETTTKKQHFLSLKGKKTVGILMLISSTIHNIMDGLAIGITYASRNNSLIISTTIAIVLHEIPKELGDAGILLHSDFNIWAVLFWNVAVNVFMILGAAIGLGVGQISQASKAYSLAFVAGNFFYISLAQMIPEVIKKKKLLQVILQYSFIVLGMGIMFLILLVESEEEEE